MISDRISTTIRMDRTMYDALQSSYYARISEHRLSFNSWLVGVIRAGTLADHRAIVQRINDGEHIDQEVRTASWYAADCPPVKGSQ